ncbi:hypothetical protein Tco_1424415 [Tanacetum coccineum]
MNNKAGSGGSGDDSNGNDASTGGGNGDDGRGGSGGDGNGNDAGIGGGNGGDGRGGSGGAAAYSVMRASMDGDIGGSSLTVFCLPFHSGDGV